MGDAASGRRAGYRAQLTVMPIGYIGKISGTDPIAGQLVANVHASLSENLLIPQYVYKTGAHQGEPLFPSACLYMFGSRARSN
jgi:hypothetical protein